MRDSRIGTYGACALIIALLLRASAIASVAAPGRVAIALVVAHAVARAMMPVFMRAVAPARPDGLAAGTGRPPFWSAAVAALIAVAVAVAGLGLAKAGVAALLLLATFVLMRTLCLRQLGGQTGDVTGALEQISETLIVLIAAA